MLINITEGVRSLTAVDPISILTWRETKGLFNWVACGAFDRNGSADGQTILAAVVTITRYNGCAAGGRRATVNKATGGVDIEVNMVGDGRVEGRDLDDRWCWGSFCRGIMS